MKKILITGSAGFVGFHLSKKFLDNNCEVIGIDALTSYYDVELKKNRKKILCDYTNYHHFEFRIEEKSKIDNLFKEFDFEIVVHLAAQAGVRYSIENPSEYINTNIIGTYNLLEACKSSKIKHFLFSSTSSVYGSNKKLPFKELVKTENPISLYAATKKSNELFTHYYSYLNNLPVTVFRFFTVYGPWGRPDMALFKFTKNIISGYPIDIYNHGKMKRDFTYIDDLINCIYKLSKVIPENKNNLLKVSNDDSLSSSAPWRVVNIGNNNPVNLMNFITEIEKCLGKKAIKNFMDIQKGDVPNTWSENKLLKELIGFVPETKVSSGIKNFVNWYQSYYSHKNEKE